MVIIGRRGPLQSAFKIKEFRELTKMADCHVRFDWPEWIREHLDFNDKLIVCDPFVFSFFLLNNLFSFGSDSNHYHGHVEDWLNYVAA